MGIAEDRDFTPIDDGRLLAKLASESRPPVERNCHGSFVVGIGSGCRRSGTTEFVRWRPAPRIAGNCGRCCCSSLSLKDFQFPLCN